VIPSDSARRSILRAATLAAVLAGAFWRATGAVAADEPPNRLEHPMADLAILSPGVAGATPRLLVVDATSPDPAVVRVSVLERDHAWSPVAGSEIDLGRSDLPDRWLVGTGPGRFALVATSPDDAVEATVIVGLDTGSDASRAVITELGRATLGLRVVEAGAADVDGDGSVELVVHDDPMPTASPVPDPSCQGTRLAVLDGGTLRSKTEIEMAGRALGGGVIGRWDAEPGDDLLAYTAVCLSLDGGAPFRLTALRLRDGSPIVDMAVSSDAGPVTAAPILRLDVDGRAPDEAVARAEGRTVVLDPARGWRSLPVGTLDAIPLVAGPDPDAAGPAWRIAVIDPGDTEAYVTERVRRGLDGNLSSDGHLTMPVPDEARRLVRSTVLLAATRGDSTGAWLGPAVDEGCPDLVMPGALLPCGATAIRPGAAWLATRPVAVLPIEGQRRLLVAAGLTWAPEALPRRPMPWAAGPAGWLRHGPSVPFALSEVRAADVTYFLDFPVPRASIDPTAAADGATQLPGFTGTRLFVSAIARRDGAEPDAQAPDPLDALGRHGARQSVESVVRVPVPPGLESGRDGSFASYSLDAVRLPDGTPADRWQLTIVPINDWGEVGSAATGTIVRDLEGPRVSVEVPFVSPVWPVPARLTGAVDPGSTVEVDGVGPVEADRRGRFAFETPLAPWPQDLRVTATDRSGNRTVQAVSIIGGLDYRQLPWAFLAALGILGVVAVRGLGAAGSLRAARVGEVAAWSAAGDDGPGPEIEDLPPGGGLGPR
jgi:hypothetical protein